MFVYVLKSEKVKRFYVGLTEDLDRRIQEHNSGKTKSTKPYRPWRMILWFECDGLAEARSMEIYLKSGAGKEYIKRYWQNNYEGKM